MKRVIIESPYAGETLRNIIYARACMLDSLERGEAPFLSHLLYTQDGILDDRKSDERELGIHAGFVWAEAAELRAVYIDYGISEGMQRGIDNAKKLGQAVEERRLSAEVLLRVGRIAKQLVGAGVTAETLWIGGMSVE